MPDSAGFVQDTEPFRRELLAHCYRMLGSIQDALERVLLDAGVPWQPAAEADGWDLLVHFASLGIGATIINGCVTPPAGLTAIPVTGLPAVRYWAAWRPEHRAYVSDLLSCLIPS